MQLKTPVLLAVVIDLFARVEQKVFLFLDTLVAILGPRVGWLRLPQQPLIRFRDPALIPWDSCKLLACCIVLLLHHLLAWDMRCLLLLLLLLLLLVHGRGTNHSARGVVTVTDGRQSGGGDILERLLHCRHVPLSVVEEVFVHSTICTTFSVHAHLSLLGHGRS